MALIDTTIDIHDIASWTPTTDVQPRWTNIVLRDEPQRVRLCIFSSPHEVREMLAGIVHQIDAALAEGVASDA